MAGIDDELKLFYNRIFFIRHSTRIFGSDVVDKYLSEPDYYVKLFSKCDDQKIKELKIENKDFLYSDKFKKWSDDEKLKAIMDCFVNGGLENFNIDDALALIKNCYEKPTDYLKSCIYLLISKDILKNFSLDDLKKIGFDSWPDKTMQGTFLLRVFWDFGGLENIRLGELLNHEVFKNSPGYMKRMLIDVLLNKDEYDSNIDISNLSIGCQYSLYRKFGDNKDFKSPSKAINFLCNYKKSGKSFYELKVKDVVTQEFYRDLSTYEKIILLDKCSDCCYKVNNSAVGIKIDNNETGIKIEDLESLDYFSLEGFGKNLFRVRPYAVDNLNSIYFGELDISFKIRQILADNSGLRYSFEGFLQNQKLDLKYKVESSYVGAMYNYPAGQPFYDHWKFNSFVWHEKCIFYPYGINLLFKKVKEDIASADKIKSDDINKNLSQIKILIGEYTEELKKYFVINENDKDQNARFDEILGGLDRFKIDLSKVASSVSTLEKIWRAIQNLILSVFSKEIRKIGVFNKLESQVKLNRLAKLNKRIKPFNSKAGKIR